MLEKKKEEKTASVVITDQPFSIIGFIEGFEGQGRGIKSTESTILTYEDRIIAQVEC